MTYSFSPFPKQGQFMIYVNLSELKHCSADSAIETLIKLGYNPELRYSQHSEGIDAIALLVDEHHDSPREGTYRMEDAIKLNEAFPEDDMAIHFVSGKPMVTSAPIAAK